MKRTGHFAAAFAIALIVIGAACAFSLVDLRTEKYMPGQFKPMLQISSLQKGSAFVSFMGRDYIIGGEYAKVAGDFIHRFRGFLPAAPRLAGELLLFHADE